MDGPQFNQYISNNATNISELQLKTSHRSTFTTYSKSIPLYTTLTCPEPRISSEIT